MGLFASTKRVVRTAIYQNILFHSYIPIAKNFYFPFPICRNLCNFGKEIPGRGIHLGDDFSVPEGENVRVAACGVVVAIWHEPGTEEKPSFGNVVVVAHRLKQGEYIYTLYGHLGEIFVKRWEKFSQLAVLGKIGKAYTIENGYCDPHLHFGIYTGPFPIFTSKGSVRMLPGYLNQKTERYTKIEYWENPRNFIYNYNAPI